MESGSGGLRGARIGGVGGIVIAPIMTEMAVKGQVDITLVMKLTAIVVIQQSVAITINQSYIS